MTTKRRKRHTPEQIVRKLRDAEAMLNAGKDQAAVLQSLEVSQTTFDRWRNQYGGMNAAERPKLQAKNDTVSLLTVAAVRGAIADDSLDGTVSAVEKIIQVTGQDIAEDMAGPSPVATKTTIKAMAEMTTGAIKNATQFNRSDGYRKATILDSVRRSRAAKRWQKSGEQMPEPIEQRSAAKYEPIGRFTRCDECGYAPADRIEGCGQCGARGDDPADFDAVAEAKKLRGTLFSLADHWPVQRHRQLAEILRAFADELTEGEA